MRKRPRRAAVDPTWPEGWATSDRNGHIGNLVNMRWQHEWRGPRLVNTRVLIHEDELDLPQRQLGSPALLGPDPPALINARVENYPIDEYPVSTRVSMNGLPRVIMQAPNGYNINRIVSLPFDAAIIKDGVR